MESRGDDDLGSRGIGPCAGRVLVLDSLARRLIQSLQMESVVARDCTPIWPAISPKRVGWLAVRAARLTRTTAFGNLVIVLFLVAQALDGGLTYLGIVTFGPEVEANPLLAWLMATLGEGPALAGAKLAAAGFGMILHLAAVHRALALLTAFYLSAAVVPWLTLLWLAGKL